MTVSTNPPATVVEPEVQVQASGKPYVGLRPYERNEQHLLFGRHRDTQFLSDKILSARLTVLYGQSGLGKSSLLRALVIPKLEENDARVIYFDAWSGEEPELALKDALVKVATKLGIPHAGAGSPTLTELARLVDLAEEGSLVLIFDQFEEFLVNHGQRLDPVRKELGALVRATGIDVQIVLSLREEFLAALEPFRQEILSLFSSTYRLEPLDEAGVHEAIEKPAKMFGVGYEPGLVKALIHDLGAAAEGGQEQVCTTGTYKATTGETKATTGETKAPTGRTKANAADGDGESEQDGGAGPVDLPMLQLVCSQLWTAAGEPRSGELSLEQYKRLGGAQKILDDYVLGVMPWRWPDKVKTARLMKLLAPPSGLKISHSIQDLVSNTGIKEKKVTDEIQRLSRCRILRSREYRSGRRYELQHDALIRVVSPWRDRILRQAKWARYFVGMGAMAFIALGLGSYWTYQAAKDLHRNTVGAMEKLRDSLTVLPDSLVTQEVQLRDSTFDNAARYLLWRRGGSVRLEGLKSLLQQNQDLLTTWYGTDTSGIQNLSFPEAADWPLTLHYSAQRKLNLQAFQAMWQSMAKVLTDEWGLPVPRSLRLVEDVTYPRKSIELRVLGVADPLRLDFAPHEPSAFLATRDLPQPAQDFLARFSDDTTEWHALPDLPNGPWWVVPRWSLPVWKTSGGRVAYGSGLVAFRLAHELLKRPEAILSETVVERLLLDRIAQDYPQTVAEAREARGSRLRLDLAELVKQGRGLQHLPMVLDALARYPEDSSSRVAALVEEDLRTSGASLPSRFHGPWKQDKAVLAFDKDTLSRSFRDAYGERWLPRATDWQAPPADSTIRVYLGSELEPYFVQGGDLGGELMDRLTTFRDGFYRRFGIELPGARFYRSGYDESLTPKQFRIRVLNQINQDEDAQPIETEPAKALDRLIAAIDFRAEALRTHWLTADDVSAILRDLDPALQRWLESRYSVTDLKLLLRAVLTPSEDEIKGWAKAEDGDSLPTPPESTVRHHDWLLRSLVFWSTAGDLARIGQTADYLRDVQRARLAGHSRPTTGNRVASYVQQGVRALRTRNLEASAQAFRAATALDSSGAIEHFLATYPEELTTILRDRVDVACRDLNSIVLGRRDRADLEDLIAARAWPASGAVRHAKLCLLGGLTTSQREKRRALMADLIASDGDPSSWSANEARWFAMQIFSHLAELRNSETLRQHGERYLKRAFGELDAPVRHAAYDTLKTICDGRGGKNWCWNLAYELSQIKPIGSMQLDLAFSLSFSERPDYLQRALELAQRAEPRAFDTSISPTASDERLDLARLIRANAVGGLASQGQGRPAIEPEQWLRALLQSPRYGSSAYLALAGKLIDEERLKEAEGILTEALGKWPNWVSLHNEHFFLHLLQGDTAAADSTAQELVALASEDGSALFIAALGQILTSNAEWERTGRAFLATDHEYVPYLAMMLYAHMAARAEVDADAVLEARWAVVDSTTWTARLTEGDPSAWREMLVGYYLGEVDSSRIFHALEDDEAWSRSAFRHLPMPWRGLRCEAYFYDALLARSKGDESRATARLRDVLKTGHRNYYEYRMARFLLKPETTVASP